MTRLADATPLSIQSRAGRVAEESARDAQVPGFFRAVGDAIDSQWIGSTLWRQVQRTGYDVDPGFTVFGDDETFKALTDGLPRDRWDVLSHAVSRDHAQVIRQQELGRLESEHELASLGWKGVGLSMAAGVLDPVAIAATVATEGIAGPALFAAKATRLARIAKAGFLAGGTFAGLEAYKATQEPEKTATDVLYAGLGGMVLGAGAHAVGEAFAAAALRLRKDIEFGDIAGAMGAASRRELTPDVRKMLDEAVLTDKGRAYFKDQLDPAGRAKFVDDLIGTSGLDPVRDADLIAEIKRADPGDVINRYFVPDELATGEGRAPLLDSGEGRPPAAAGEAPAEALPARDPRLRPPTEEEIVARAEQVKADFPAMTDAAARETAIVQIATDDAARPPHGKAPPPAEGKGPPEPPPKVAGDLDQSGITSAKSALGFVRFSMAGRLGQSRSPSLRMAATAYMQDALLKAGGGPAVEAASEWVTRTFNVFRARYAREADTAFAEWARGRGVPALGRAKAEEEFYDEVGLAVRRPLSLDTHPAVKRVADLQRRLQSELHGLAVRHGVKGFDRFNAADDYLTRVWSVPRIDAAVGRWGEEAVRDAFAASMRSVTEGLTEEASQNVARGFLRTLRGLDRYTDLDRVRMFSGEQADDLIAILRDNIPGITEQQLHDIAYVVAPRDADAGTIARARRRLRLDENHLQTMPDGLPLTMTDLMESNGRRLFTGYARQVIGASAEAEALRVMSGAFDPTGVLRLTTFGQLKARLIDEMNTLGMSVRSIESELGKLETARKVVVGLKVGNDTATADFLRGVRGVNYIRVSGGFGIAQAPDLGNLVGTAGVRVMLQQMPAATRIFTRLKSGRMANELAEEVEVLLGLGVDRLANRVVGRFDEAASMETFGGGALQRMIDRGGRLSNDLSFMAPVNTFLQKASGLFAAQKITNMAFSGKGMSAKRLASLGLTAQDAERVFAQLRAHATTEEGLLGLRLRRTNVEDWTDQTAAARFITALDKWSRQAVQENDVGNLAQWMTTDMGRTIIQFRTFSAAAWEKQFLHRVQMRDWETFTSAMGASLVAGLGYAGQQYAASIGRADREEFLAKRLDPEEIAKAAFQRGGWSSLMPQLSESVWGAVGGDPLFTARNTGLAASILNPMANPSADFATAALYDAPRGVGRSLMGKDAFTQKDGRAIAKLLPFQNVIGIKNVIDAMTTRLPER